MNFFKHHKFSVWFQWLILAILVAVLALTLWQIVQNFESIKVQGMLRRRHRLFGPSEQLTANQISGWMTFRYINLVFHLPSGYLQSSLNISDKRYPNLSIDAWAKITKKTSVQALYLVEQALEHSAKPVPAAH